MKGVIFTITTIIIALFSSNAYAQKEITISEECVYLDELTAPSVPHAKVTCGFTPGTTKTFTKDIIENHLRRIGINAKVLKDVVVTRQGEKLSVDDIIKKVEEEYKKVYSDITIKVEQVRDSKEFFAEKTENFKVNVDTTKFGSTYITIDNGIKTASLYVYVRAYREAFIANQRIKAGDTIEDKVRTELIDVTNIRGNLVSNLSNVIASKGITQGKPITEDLIQDKPALSKGETVKLVFDNGTIKIETTGVIEEDAFVGKLVQVRNAVSQKVITAKYIGNGVAKAHF